MARGQNAQKPQRARAKRTRAPAPQPVRRSARLEALRQTEPAPASGRRTSNRPNANSGARKQTPVSRKRPRSQNDPDTPPAEPSDERLAEERTRTPTSRGSQSEDYADPISYWAVHKKWPRQFLTDMANLLPQNLFPQKRPRTRKNSDLDISMHTSTTPSGQTSREEKGVEYRRPEYERLLQTKGVFMVPSAIGITASSTKLCQELFTKTQITPQNTAFDNHRFHKTCTMILGRNEAKIIQDITRLIVPSVELLANSGEELLDGLIESVNEGWNHSIPITQTRPQPDYAVGFREEAFTQDQLNRMSPVVGNFKEMSYFMATRQMYFPFLSCEVKSGAASLDVADRQNAHCAAIAVRAVVGLFRAVKREKELHREILAFSISHDHRIVRIYGYYAEFAHSEAKYYRHPIHEFSFTALDGREKWTTYKFTKNIYHYWAPKHLERICSAINQMPTNAGRPATRSVLNDPEQPSGLSQGLNAHGTAQPSTGAAPAQAQDNTQSNIDRETVSTPGTPVTSRAFKRPRRET